MYNVNPRMERISGDLSGAELRVGIVVSRWNSGITNELEAGARRALIACGLREDMIETVEVPGAFEIPLALHRLASTKRYHGLIAVGCVIKGDTTHFEHVSDAAMRGIYDVMMERQIPIGCAVLTTYTVEQAEARSGRDEENKGSEAALATVEMINLLKKL